MNFTSSPFERMMKEKPRPQAPAENRPPRGSACYGCCYWRGIRSLVVTWCANYDREYGCLPLDSDCYMLGKCWTGSYCRYFRESVLPLDPALEASLMCEGPRPDFKICPVCGGPVPPDRRQAYCSAACAKKAHRRQQREYMRKKRGASVDN